MFAVFIGKTSV